MTMLVSLYLTQASANPECTSSQSCSRPSVSRSGNLASWASYVGELGTLSYEDDADADGRPDSADNCRFVSNRDQLDGDGDGVGDSCDNCAANSNVGQLDQDGDAIGDVCDSDLDGDGVLNALDNCAALPNPTVGGVQPNLDGDVLGDRCDDDLDGDGFSNALDLCPRFPSANNVAQPGQTCSLDGDLDGVPDHADNCPGTQNTNLTDTDLDGLGDVCDADADADGVRDPVDNCARVANRAQTDADSDGVGDACDAVFCLVIDPSNRADCLDPQGPFRVHSGGSVQLLVGERFRLPLFANRNGVAIRYQWVVTQRPAGSFAQPLLASGTASASRAFAYAYPFGEVPSFAADRMGLYQLQLLAELVFPDAVYPAVTQSVHTLNFDAR
ncbi:MAG: thrombospondin type 3 repeat-containing protein [Myxococcaceae bacterium]|nr:thrombospondin type 3 repeat-containing protein [Myxococcaceae bacterium]